MIQQTIDELRKLKEHMESMSEFYSQDELFITNKAIIACEQLRKAKKKAKRWKRKYLEIVANRPCEICIYHYETFNKGCSRWRCKWEQMRKESHEV